MKKVFILVALWLCCLCSGYCNTCDINEVDVNMYPFKNPGKMLIVKNNNYILILEEIIKSLKIIDTSTNAVVGQIELDIEPSNLIESYDKNTVYINSLYSGKIALLDISQQSFENWKVTDYLTISEESSASLGAMAINQKTQELYVIDNALNGIQIINTNDITKDPKTLLDTTGRCTDASDIIVYNGNLFLSCETGNIVSVFNLSDMSHVKNIATGKSPIDMIINPENTKIFVANSQGPSISVIDIETLEMEKNIENKNILSNPFSMIYAQDKVRIVDKSQAKLVTLDPEVLDLELGSCQIMGDRPCSIVYNPDKDIFYIAHKNGVDYLSYQGEMKLYVKQSGDTDFKKAVDVLLNPLEIFEIKITGGIGPFEVSGTGGLKAQADENDERIYTITAPGIEGNGALYVEDKTSGERYTLFIFTGATLSISPAGPIDVELGGQSRVLYASGGFPPYSWRTDTGILSSSTARYVVYTPQLKGEDQVNLCDSTGECVNLKINVTISGIVISPAVCVMMKNEEKKFIAIGGSEYRWTAPIGGNFVENTNQEVVFTAPDNIGRYEIIVEDLLNGEIAAAIIDVIDEEIEITPLKAEIGREETAVFSVVGGKGPYTWTVEKGDLNTTEGLTVFYTAPKTAGINEIIVRDIGGRTAVGKIIIGKGIKISPVSPVVSKGENIEFSLSGATGTVAWTASDGTFSEKNDSKAIWTAPQKSGKFYILATDDTGSSVQAVVKVVSDLVNISPGQTEVKQGQTVLFKVTGGSSPYTWNAETGSLSSSEGGVVYWTAPHWMPEESVYIRVEDSSGELAQSDINITSGDPGIWLSSTQATYNSGEEIKLNVKTSMVEEWDIYVALFIPDISMLIWFKGAGIENIAVDMDKWNKDGTSSDYWQTALELPNYGLPVGEYSFYGAIVPKGMDLFDSFNNQAAILDFVSFLVK